MYLRFALPKRNNPYVSREGVFTACYALLEEDRLTEYEEKQVRSHLDWFDRHLPAPECLDDVEHRRALCWFRSDAHDHIETMWELVGVLHTCCVPVELLKTRWPGTIVYEDEWQIAAVPGRRGCTWVW
jgi:hypothetical protein